MSSAHSSPDPSADDAGPSFSWLTAAAFVLMLCIVAARAMMLETDHDLSSGVHGAGPTSALILDLLCALTAMIPLIRRIFEKGYRLRLNWSHALMALIAAWMVLSVLWAGDRFSAMLGASHFIAALCVLFAASQLVRSWKRLRLVTAILIGLLGAQICNGMMYRFSEWPGTVAYFEQNKPEILRQHGWAPNEFAARQFEQKLKSGEVMGFTASPNSYAALLVMLAVVAMGWIIQRWSERLGQDWAIIALVALTAAAGLAMIGFTYSKTGAVTPILAVLAFAAAAAGGKRLHAHARAAFWIGLALFVVCVGAVIAHGLAHQSLVIDSLTFRWRYWVGSWRMFEHHPWLGVGWTNFGQHYLHFRLPIASEEIKDPHNFIVRFLTELGLVGAVLVIAWMGRLWWELTRPTLPPLAPSPELTDQSLPQQRQYLLGWLLLVIGGAFVINVAAAIDWTQWNRSGSYIVLELLRRGIYFAVMYILATAAAVHSLEKPHWDRRPANWMLIGLLIAAAIFLLHNLIDFSLFETGPLMVFVLIAGAALGARNSVPRRIHHWSHARVVAAASLAAAILLWLATALLVLIPTAEAEQLALQAQDAADAHRFDQAADLMNAAFLHQPLNGAYAYHASQLRQQTDLPLGMAIDDLNLAIRADPFNTGYYIQRAELELRQPAPDRKRAEQDYRRALEQDPNDIPNHLRFAQLLEQWNQPAAARTQYEDALRINDALEKGDPRRLSPARVGEIQEKLRTGLK
jgi:O-antigen ligase/tetratricopeptide (TPR) repeat protein